MNITSANTDHNKRIRNYYKFHSRIYDLSRWSFLFGRDKILELIPPLPVHPHILEIGCGTGRNIKRLANEFPDAKITGIDLSSDMLKVARKKLGNSNQIQLIEGDYFSDNLEFESFDLILLSYSLTMFGGQAENALEQVSRNLSPNGCLAVVDFNTTPVPRFQKWMEMNHVDFSGQFLPLLKKNFRSVKCEVNEAYLGLWNYFLFVGNR